MTSYQQAIRDCISKRPNETSKALIKLIDAALDQKRPSKRLRSTLNPLLTILNHRYRLVK